MLKTLRRPEASKKELNHSFTLDKPNIFFLDFRLQNDQADSVKIILCTPLSSNKTLTQRSWGEDGINVGFLTEASNKINFQILLLAHALNAFSSPILQLFKALLS